jgi:mannitol/fructose-specific phosphotransferase system IIA component (Ntr-type)
LEGRQLICQDDEVLKVLLNLLNDSSEVIQKDALLTLVNLTADPAGAEKILNISTTEQVIIA